MKADPKIKADAKAEVAAEAAPAKGSKKKLLLMILVALFAIGAASGLAWYFMRPTTHKEAKVEVPATIPIDPITVNLQPEVGEQFLLIAFTLQVANIAQVDIIKQNMPQVKSRLLLLFSSKKASEISTSEGKKLLFKEIIAQLNRPFAPGAPPQQVTEVFLTQFIIQ